MAFFQAASLPAATSSPSGTSGRRRARSASWAPTAGPRRPLCETSEALFERFSMRFPCIFHGVPWFSMGFFMVFQCFFLFFSMVFHGFSMDFNGLFDCFFHGFARPTTCRPPRQARRTVLTEDDSVAPTASSEEMCVICMERRRTQLGGPGYIAIVGYMGYIWAVYRLL